MARLIEIAGGQPIPGLHLTREEIKGLEQYQREQDKGTAFSSEPVNGFGKPKLNLKPPTTRPYILRPGTGQPTRRPHKHTHYEEKGRELARMDHPDLAGRHKPVVPVWRLRIPPVEKYSLPNGHDELPEQAADSTPQTWVCGPCPESNLAHQLLRFTSEGRK